MAISTQTQNLNLIPGKSAPVVVHLSQGNVGNMVQFYLYDGDNPYYPTNVSIAVHGVRADGSVFGPYAVSVTGGSNLVSFTIVTAMTSVNGAAIGELVISDSSQNQIGSANFGMLVEETPYSSSVTYEDDLSIYQRILAYVQSIPAGLQSQITAEVSARSSAVTNLQSQITAEAKARNNAVSDEAAARSSADTNLQSQINQYVSPSSEQPTEVVNARVNKYGRTFSTLKERLDDDCTYTENAIAKDINVSDTIDSPATKLNHDCYFQTGKAYPGQKIHIKAHGEGGAIFVLYKITTPQGASTPGLTVLARYLTTYTATITVAEGESLYGFRFWVSTGGSSLSYSFTGDGMRSEIDDIKNIMSYIDVGPNKTDDSGTISIENARYGCSNDVLFEAESVSYTAIKNTTYQYVNITIRNPFPNRRIIVETRKNGGVDGVMSFLVNKKDGTTDSTSVFYSGAEVYEIGENIDSLVVRLVANAGTSINVGSVVSFDNVRISYQQSGQIYDNYDWSYIAPLMANYKHNQTSSGNTFTPAPFTFIHISDIHGAVTEWKRALAFQDIYSHYIDTMILSGDISVSNYEDSGFSDLYAVKRYEVLLPVLGNHDAWTDGTSGCKSWTVGYSAKQCYTKFIQPYISSFTSYEENKCYWMKDYSYANVRVIGIDNYHWKEQVTLSDDTTSSTYPNGDPVDTGQQLSWFVSQLSAAKDNSRSVIVVCHEPPANPNLVDCSFTTLDDYGNGLLQTEAINAVQDFIDAGGDFVMWVCGHIHQDKFGTISGYPKQAFMTVDTARGARENNVAWSNNARLANTRANDCFNVVSVDTVRKYIRVARIGTEFDRHGRHLGNLVYDYGTNRLLWNS